MIGTAGVLDHLFLNGTVQRLKYHSAALAIVKYRSDFRGFLSKLTLEQMHAIDADPAEHQNMQNAITFLAIYGRSADAYLMKWRQEYSAYADQPATANVGGNPQNGTTVYRASECIGAIVNGECHGSILPQTATHPVCHGQMINGMCTGPMF